MDSYDALIVGGGPAGLSAALILARCKRRVLLCDTGQHRNSASQGVNGFLGHEGRPPIELLSLGRQELKKYHSITHASQEVTSIEASVDGFAFTLADHTPGRARKVLLATGLVDDLPRLPGIDALYGKSVHHCLYCDGFEHCDEPMAAYGYGEKGAALALMMKHWSTDLVLCTDGSAPLDSPMRERLDQLGIRIVPDHSGP